MSFLKRLFGGDKGSREYSDPNGIYLYFRSNRSPDAVSRVRIDKQYDLNKNDAGFVWHKTVVDSKYFSRIDAVVYFDRNHSITSADLVGGQLITELEYEAAIGGTETKKE